MVDQFDCSRRVAKSPPLPACPANGQGRGLTVIAITLRFKYSADELLLDDPAQHHETAAKPRGTGRTKMKRILAAATLSVLPMLASLPAAAQDKVKIGLIVTLSGPPAVLGQQARDGFNLAVKTLGGKMGGKDVEIVVADDELKPDVAVTKVKGLLERDKVDFVVGPIFSNVLLAIHKPVVESNAILISPNAGPSSLAGKACRSNFFVTSYQNDQVHQVLGKVAQERGYKRVYLLVPNYQAGKDAVAGFKVDYKGEVVEESYVPLNTLDFQGELSKIAAFNPDAIFTFMPGGMGVNLVKQYRQAGLADRIPFLSAFTVDESTWPAQQDAAIGLFGGANWAPDLDLPQNKAFVSAYEAAYHAVPGTYAAQAYDAAMLIDSAVKAVNGNLADKAGLQASLKKADFSSVRGSFKFNTNNFPIQDFYLVKAAKRPDGKFQTEIVQKVFSNFGDPFAKDCAATH
jgi:branched-chain amino acid transport system substrate-binding protein